jgi:hypothetical protein
MTMSISIRPVTNFAHKTVWFQFRQDIKAHYVLQRIHMIYCMRLRYIPVSNSIIVCGSREPKNWHLWTNHTERKKNLRNTQRIHSLSGIISKQHHVSNFNNKEYVSKNDITKPQKILGNHNKAASTYVLSIPIGQNKNSSNYVPIVTNNELPINQRDKAQQFMNTEHKPKAIYVLTYPLEKKNISSRMSNLTFWHSRRNVFHWFHWRMSGFS